VNGLDWSQIWYPGPTRVFSMAELQQAGGDRPTRTLQVAVLVNFALLAFMTMQFAPAAATAGLTLVMAIAAVLGRFGALALWERPSRRALAIWTLAGTAALAATTVVSVELKDLARGTPERAWVLSVGLATAALLAIVWWFVAVYRAQQIEARLREQAEQARALAMAGQLAAAQIQPHFLFNSLASLQHWVQAKDDRAAPMLAALTGFLRATLPLFNRPRLALGDEAEAVRQYLAVMRLRLGERLAWSVEVDERAAAAQVPPGLLLTLVENAVEHGVVPALAGAELRVQARADGLQVALSVIDTGPGLAPGAAEGVGLANTRNRLSQAFGARAALSLENAAGGGCVARIHFPLETP
jgi:Histidine kinase